jgi:hypothetical protein
MSRLIARAIDRTLSAVAAKVVPLLSAKPGRMPAAEFKKTIGWLRDDVRRGTNAALNRPSSESIAPVAILDVGCGLRLEILSRL